jgi:GGDEF domain-containing protein
MAVMDAALRFDWLKTRWHSGATPAIVLASGLVFAPIGWLAATTLEAAPAAAVNGLLAAAVAGLILRKRDGDHAPEGSAQLFELRRQVDGVRRGAIYDETTGLLNRWYFEMRLGEELTRSRRYKIDLALLTIKIAPPNLTGLTAMETDMMTARIAHQALRTVRAADIPAAIGDLEYAVCLVHCNREGAEAAVSRLLDELHDQHFQIGLAVYPEDQGSAKEMIEIARRRVHWALGAA